MTNLGYANDWNGVDPEEVAKCDERGHVRYCECVNPSGTMHRYWCEECGFEYYVDSGD